MKKPARAQHALERQMAQFEAIAGLQGALDNGYRRVRETAHREWQRYLAGQSDPSDECVTVRIRASEAEKRSFPGAAILRVRQSTIQKANRRLPRPRFAV